MTDYPNKKELAAQEKIINLIERIQAVPKQLWALLVLTLIFFLPLQLFLRGAFANFFINAYHPPEIIYVAPIPAPLDISQVDFFDAGSSQIFAFARVRNLNADLGIRILPYEFQALDGQGKVLVSFSGESYILPNQEKLIFMPLQAVSNLPQKVIFSPKPDTWSRIPDFLPVSFNFENQNFGLTQEGKTYVEGILLNDSPYFISDLELGILLYNLSGNVVSANSTTISSLTPHERRYFRVIGRDSGAENAVRAEFLPSVNQLKKGVLSTQGLPLDSRDFGR